MHRPDSPDENPYRFRVRKTQKYKENSITLFIEIDQKVALVMRIIVVFFPQEQLNKVETNKKHDVFIEIDQHVAILMRILVVFV